MSLEGGLEELREFFVAAANDWTSCRFWASNSATLPSSQVLPSSS